MKQNEYRENVYREIEGIPGDPARVLRNAPLKEYTTFRVGGPADMLVCPADEGELAALIRLAREKNIPFLILGNGSNVLIRDEGFDGLVILLRKTMGTIRVDGDVVTAGAGALLSQVAGAALEASLTGFEFASGIPGSAGGAVFMNAGAYGGEMSHVVRRVRAVLPDGSVRWFSAAEDELRFGYRHSVFCENGGVITEVEFQLAEGAREDILAAMNELNQRRRDKQPLNLASAGSTFKRPKGHFAGRLIEDSGCKGLGVGGAMVSPKHAGFVVNTGNATAQDILDLIALVQMRVKDCFGIDLEPEVRIIGSTGQKSG